ncbi:MAG: pyridoxal-dependent decarboxylase [Gammaproteobacteria bacterium]
MFTVLWNMAANIITTTDETFEGYSPSTLIAGAAVATLVTGSLIQRAYKKFAQPFVRPIVQTCYENWPASFSTRDIKKSLAETCKDVPLVGRIIRGSARKKLNEIARDIQKDVDKLRKELGPVFARLPENGVNKDAVLAIMARANDHYLKGRSSGTWYSRPDEDYEALLDGIYSATKFTNPMHDEEFPLIDKMTAEVLSMCQYLFNGDPTKFNTEKEKKLAGLITDGGTASNFEAMRAYVRYAREVLKIENPEVIVPETAHVSFENAAITLRVPLIKAPVNKTTDEVNVKTLESLITKNTCMIVGSAPQFLSGTMDPIEKLGAIALKHKIPLHVDACLGGFLTAFAKKAGLRLPSSDFSVPGVTSISTDPHKYGQAPKGSSVLLFHHNCAASSSAIFTNLKWVGGMYVAQGMKGSRQGHVVATVWGDLVYHGEKWFVAETRKIVLFTNKLTQELKKVRGIRITIPPQLSVIKIDTEEGINAHLVASRLKKLHWNLNLLQTTNQKPDGFHFCVTAMHESVQQEILTQFIKDLTECVEYARLHPKEKPSGTAGVYGMLPDVPDFAEKIVGSMYASIHNSLSSELVKQNGVSEVKQDMQQMGFRRA